MKINVKSVIIAGFLIVAIIGSFFIPRRDLHSIAQVAGIALDRSGDRICATFELFDPVLDKPIGTQRKVVFAEGTTMNACIDAAKHHSSAELYLNDASVLILGDGVPMDLVFDYYSSLAHDHMDLPIFYAHEQSASEIFKGEGKILSTELAKSAEKLDRLHTIRDFMNGEGQKVYVQGSGSYEIIF